MACARRGIISHKKLMPCVIYIHLLTIMGMGGMLWMKPWNAVTFPVGVRIRRLSRRHLTDAGSRRQAPVPACTYILGRFLPPLGCLPSQFQFRGHCPSCFHDPSPRSTFEIRETDDAARESSLIPSPSDNNLSSGVKNCINQLHGHTHSPSENNTLQDWTVYISPRVLVKL